LNNNCPIYGDKNWQKEAHIISDMVIYSKMDLKSISGLYPHYSLKAYGSGLKIVRLRILKTVSGKVVRLILKGNWREYPGVSYVSFFFIQIFSGFPYMRAFI